MSTNSEPQFGFLVPLDAKADRVEDVSNFLLTGYELVQEEAETIQWFGIKYASLPNAFAIFDTFATANGRKAHLAGKVAEALLGNAPELLSPAPEIGEIEIVASKVNVAGEGKTAGLANGLKVLIHAKPGQALVVREFLYDALSLVNAEPDTPVWYAIAIPGTDTYGIIDFFPSEAARNTHLEGAVAKALFAKAPELLQGAPEVTKFDVVAAKVT